MCEVVHIHVCLLCVCFMLTILSTSIAFANYMRGCRAKYIYITFAANWLNSVHTCIHLQAVDVLVSCQTQQTHPETRNNIMCINATQFQCRAIANAPKLTHSHACKQTHMYKHTYMYTNTNSACAYVLCKQTLRPNWCVDYSFIFIFVQGCSPICLHHTSCIKLQAWWSPQS